MTSLGRRESKLSLRILASHNKRNEVSLFRLNGTKECASFYWFASRSFVFTQNLLMHFQISAAGGPFLFQQGTLVPRFARRSLHIFCSNFFRHYLSPRKIAPGIFHSRFSPNFSVARKSTLLTCFTIVCALFVSLFNYQSSAPHAKIRPRGILDLTKL